MTEHASRRHDRPRLHGRRTLPGLAGRPPLLRPSARPRDDRRRRPQPRPRSRHPPASGAGPRAATDWREVIARDDIDVVDIVTPGDTHAEIAIAALEAGKHVLCEKPLANTVAEAEAMAAAAARAAERGIRSMVGFTYRRVPATTFARDLVAAGRIGDIRQVRAEYLQDWLMDAEAPLTWRMQKDRAGSGALGDIGAHADRPHRVHHRPAASRRVSGIIETIVAERPLLGEGVGLSGTASTERGAGHRRRPRALHRPPRVRRARLVRGDPLPHRPQERACASRSRDRKGAIAFDLERLNELEFYDATLPDDRAGLPADPRHRARPPVPRAVVADGSYARLRARLLAPGVRLRHGDRATATQPRPSFADGLHVQRVLDAVERSSAAGSAWTPTDRLTPQPLASRSTTGRNRNVATDHPLHRPVGRPPFEEVARLAAGVGLRRPRDRLLGRSPRPVAVG